MGIVENDVAHVTDVPLSSVLGLDPKEPPFSSLTINFGNEVFPVVSRTFFKNLRVHSAKLAAFEILTRAPIF